MQSLNDEQKKTYLQAMDQRQASLKAATQALYDAHENGTLAKAYLGRMSGMSDDDAAKFLQKESESGFLDAKVIAQMKALSGK